MKTAEDCLFLVLSASSWETNCNEAQVCCTWQNVHNSYITYICFSENLLNKAGIQNYKHNILIPELPQTAVTQVANINSALRELLRVLKPKSKAAILDFNNASKSNPAADFIQGWALENVVVPAASSYGLEDEYRYLRPSIQSFPSGRDFPLCRVRYRWLGGVASNSHITLYLVWTLCMPVILHLP